MKKNSLPFVFILFVLFTCSTDESPITPNLTFEINGEQHKTLHRVELLIELDSEEITLFDQVHQKEKTYRVFVLSEVLDLAYENLGQVPNRTLTFYALDGYVVEATVSQALESGGYLAFEDLDVSGSGNWELVTRQNDDDPAPFYIVWSGEGQSPDSYPWPYQLSRINLED